MIICDVDNCNEEAKKRRISYDEESSYVSDLCNKHWKECQKKYKIAIDKIFNDVLNGYNFNVIEYD